MTFEVMHNSDIVAFECVLGDYHTATRTKFITHVLVEISHTLVIKPS